MAWFPGCSASQRLPLRFSANSKATKVNEWETHLELLNLRLFCSWCDVTLSRGRQSRPSIIHPVDRMSGPQMMGSLSPPAVHLGSKEAAPRPWRSSHWWPGNIITDSSAFTSMTEAICWLDLVTVECTAQQIYSAAHHNGPLGIHPSMLLCPQGGPEDVPHRPPLAFYRFPPSWFHLFTN